MTLKIKHLPRFLYIAEINCVKMMCKRLLKLEECQIIKYIIFYEEE